MKKLVLVTLLLILPALSFAQVGGSAPGAGSGSNSTYGSNNIIAMGGVGFQSPWPWQSDTYIAVDLKDVPLKDAFAAMFRAAGDAFLYRFDPALDRNPYDKVRVSVKVQNTDLNSALNSLAAANDLLFTATRENSKIQYTIGPRPSVDLSTSYSNSQSTAPFVSVRSRGTGMDRRLDVDVRNADVRAVIEQFFSGSGLNYVVEPGVSGTTPPIRMQDVPFPDALSVLLKTAHLTIRKESGVYHISPQRELPQVADSLDIHVGQEPARDITVCIQAMPVSDAVRMVEPGWSFQGNLGSIVIPGARFYQFPREMAVPVLLAEAGLMPPTGQSRLVTRRGRFDLSILCPINATRALTQNQGYAAPGMASRAQAGPVARQYIPPGLGNASPVDQSYAAPMTNSRMQAASQNVGGMIIPVSGGSLAIAEYQRPNTGGKLLFIILADRAVDTDVIEKLFAVSGKGYAMGDVMSRPRLSRQVETSNGSQKNIDTTRFQSPSVISLQLIDATLDQALDTIVPTVGLQYRKLGPLYNPTYLIEAGPGRSRPLAPQAKPMPRR